MAFIPSPTNGIVHIGPVPLHAYGLMLAIGVLVATKVAETRWTRSGRDPKDFNAIVVPVVIVGVVGARVYHSVHRLQLERRRRHRRVRDLEGRPVDLGRGRRRADRGVRRSRAGRNLDAVALMDAIAPGVVLAQAIGRWGNYFNQELFGRPTKLPWALEIDVAHRPPGFTQYATFHPTFLYESLWCLLVFGTILFVERRVHVEARSGVRAVRRHVHLRPHLVRGAADRRCRRESSAFVSTCLLSIVRVRVRRSVVRPARASYRRPRIARDRPRGNPG